MREGCEAVACDIMSQSDVVYVRMQCREAVKSANVPVRVPFVVVASSDLLLLISVSERSAV